MKKTTILSLAAALAAAAAGAALLGRRTETPAQEPEREEPPAPVDPDKTVAFPLKNKYADYTRGEDQPVYRFELDTPNGVKEVEVTEAHYETYYIGDEVLCFDTPRGLEIV